jgi:hypothetical protein
LAKKKPQQITLCVFFPLKKTLGYEKKRRNKKRNSKKPIQLPHIKTNFFSSFSLLKKEKKNLSFEKNQKEKKIKHLQFFFPPPRIFFK